MYTHLEFHGLTFTGTGSDLTDGIVRIFLEQLEVGNTVFVEIRSGNPTMKSSIE